MCAKHLVDVVTSVDLCGKRDDELFFFFSRGHMLTMQVSVPSEMRRSYI